MSEPHFIIMQIANGYIAISNSNGCFTARSLEGFGAYLRDQIRKTDANDDVEFSFSAELRTLFAKCPMCHGTAAVETDGVAGQYLRDEFDTIDWSKKATATCPNCCGLGVEFPEFWRARPATA
jgi:hypothetical protein